MPEPRTGILDNSVVQGIGYATYAIGVALIDKNYTSTYNYILKAVAAFGGHAMVAQAAADMEKMRVRGELPRAAPAPKGESQKAS
jgi:hypothetical protein